MLNLVHNNECISAKKLISKGSTQGQALQYRKFWRKEIYMILRKGRKEKSPTPR